MCESGKADFFLSCRVYVVGTRVVPTSVEEEETVGQPNEMDIMWRSWEEVIVV